MKNKLAILSVIVIFGLLPVGATLKVSDTTREDYLKNSGYSAATIDMVNAGKAAANGEEYVPAAAKDHARYCAPIRWLRSLVIYLDPAMENPDFTRHDIKMTPNVNDL